MRGLTAALALAMALASGSSVAAQVQHGQVLPPGQLRLSAGAQLVRADSRFGGAGVATGLDGALTPLTFSGLSQMSSVVSSFLAATDGLAGATPMDPSLLDGGTLSTDLSSNYRYLPIRLAVGLLPRVELAVQLPVFRTENLFTRTDLAPGNVGVGTEAARISAILTRLGPPGVMLAESPLLPLASSPLGLEITRRVRALTGDSLPLPATAATYAELLSRYPTLLPASRTMSEWQPGDLEIEGRIEVLRSFSGDFFPEDSAPGFDYRLTAIAAARIPTGSLSGEEYGFGIHPGVGYTGGRVGAVADLFLGRSYWMTGGGMLEMLGGAEAVVIGPEGALSDFGRTTITRTPGASVDLWAEPRRRLTDELAVGLLLRSELWGDGEDEIGGLVVPFEGGFRHSLGASLSYSTLPAAEAVRGLPIEATLGFTTSLAGTSGMPETGIAYVQVSLLQRLWGRAAASE